MKIGIMQPYFLPYLGYWQLINYVDKFVIYDDVNFIKGGWINRNRYLYQGEAKIFNIIMQGASPFKKINEIDLMPSGNVYNPMKKLLSTFEMAYKKAPYYPEVRALLERLSACNESNMSKFIEFSLKEVSKYLGIETEFIISSDIKKNDALVREERVKDICKVLRGNVYVNPIGGMELYDYDDFKKSNIDLKFLKMHEISYKQFDKEFVPNLSIIDVLMFNDIETVKEMLDRFDLV